MLSSKERKKRRERNKKEIPKQANKSCKWPPITITPKRSVSNRTPKPASVCRKAQPSTSKCNQACTPAITESGVHCVDPDLYAFRQFAEQVTKNCGETDDLNDIKIEDMLPLSCYQNDCSQGLDEMFKDTLDLIREDGMYMERISMDLNVVCILCSWAGPKTGLDIHIRKMHPNKVIKMDPNSNKMIYEYMLSSLYSQWLRHVLLHHELGLYALSARVHESSSATASFCVHIKSLSPQTNRKACSITVSNKVNGHPFTWRGPILPYRSTPEDDNTEGLNVPLSSLDLMPNSANLKVMNRQLVSASSSKAIVGQPMLNNLQVIVIVAIY